jgi:hypothetical protein
LTAEGTTSKGTGSISCEVEFCIFYRLSLRILQTKDVFSKCVGTITAGFNAYSSNYCCELQQSDSKFYRKSEVFVVQKQVLNGRGAEK